MVDCFVRGLSRDFQHFSRFREGLALWFTHGRAKGAAVSTQDRISEEAIYYEAVDKPADQREAYLQAACGHDAGLLARVRVLLKAHEVQDTFLESAPWDPAVVLDTPTLTEGPGTGVGRYKLLEKIGEGGMAVVYLAEQTEPIRRKVALKIIKLGMDTRQVIARFEAERQALALMDHPSIAKVLDAGATETGRPYFVMELVQGVSITEYCDKNRLSTKDRLNLFLQVCQAVQHAHTKGIIHRDIKPSNVMVTHHDGRPVPKVIDFGIAKATNQKLTEKTLFTRYAHLIGTPAYMSPEQAQLSDLDIDTRSDIYSLGVLLYELLTGTTPFSEEELRKAGYLEMQRVIREQEPVKPSTRIKTALRKASVPLACKTSWRGRLALACRGHPARATSWHRHPADETWAGSPCHEEQGQDALATKSTGGTPVILMGRMPMLREVRGDLDWIVMKTLEKDRARRYETASGLAEDIRRHLEHEPVLARGPSTGYRLRKFLRRRRSQILSALVLTVAAGAAVVGLSQWSQGRRRLAEAEGLRHQAEGLRHRETLSQAREQYAKGDRDAALETIRSILDSSDVGPEARLLQAGILVDNRHPEEAVQILNRLSAEPQEIAGAAHALLARILWESGALDADRLKQIEAHRRQAEALLFGVPPSGGKDQSDPRKGSPKRDSSRLGTQRGTPNAEAYFLRAMTAPTIKEQLAALEEALRLDPDHYESRRLRAFTYYASRKYDLLREDALLMMHLRRGDPLGYSLRAIAFRELGKDAEALAAYDEALARTPQEDPQYLDLTAQRSETLLRMGSYARVIADAQKVMVRWPDRPVFPYHLFCALTALREDEKAEAVFREIVQRTPTARNDFWVWATKYVFDTLEAGRSWHPPDHEPTGAAFLPLLEAEETYRGLSAKAHRVVTNGFSAQWSPDGKKLAFSLGVHGYSGVALYDPATQETELLIVPGKDPRWSPDGKYIAFVRDCQALRLEELTTTERKEQTRWARDEEVWVMNADATEPRRLVRGGWPSWGKDSTQVYYHSRLDDALYSISLLARDVEAKHLIACPSYRPSISPDNQRVAYVEDASLKVRDLASQAVVAQWPVPFDTWGGPVWSPTGQELCLGAGSSVGDRTGLWIYPLDGNEPVKVLDSQIMAASWAPEGTKLVFGLRPPYFELWTAALDPALSTVKALGPGQTLAEHWQDMLRLYARRIETDPQDAYAYADRARYYEYRHEQTNVSADMRRWSALMSGRSHSDSWFDTLRGLRHVIELPFDCELVFSAERPLNEILVMSVAFGQKGRCEMKLFEIPMVVGSLLSICLFSGLGTPAVHADFAFGQPMNLGPVVNSPSWDLGPCISTDSLSLYFESNRSGGSGQFDIWVTTRATTNDGWPSPVNLGPTINSPSQEWGSCISADRLELYLTSDRPGGSGKGDLWVATRATTGDDWGTPINLGTVVNSASHDWVPSVSSDGLSLFFASDRSNGFGSDDIYVVSRVAKNAPWAVPVNLGPMLNSPAGDDRPYISADGLSLFFNSNRSGGSGGYDLWVARRRTITDSWGSPVNLGPTVNTISNEAAGKISTDGSMLYFQSDRPGGNGSTDLWQIPVLPVVDLNGDGKVDVKDMGLLVDHWGENISVCDIGPFAWGDGMVDEQDLRVLMESLMTPGPKVTDVPCDVVLNWIAFSLAQTCDVYLGTSRETVSNASRTNPQGVLVSQGQVASTYDPEGLLEFNQTYYWRVDFVIADPAPATYQGPVLSFTTAGLTYPIKNITATASTMQAGSGPEKTVDGSGLDQNDGHSISAKDMWWSTGAGPNWIQYEFDRVYPLHELWVWNFNTVLDPFMGFGAKTVQIEYSTDGTTWTPLADVPEFARGTGKAGYTANTIVPFGGVPAKFVKLTIEKNWSATAPQTGLSEVRFFAIQSAATAQP
jgi:serine/threonine protein kinase/Tol biopolymer transport system component